VVVGFVVYLSPYCEVNESLLPGIPTTTLVPLVVRFTSFALVNVPGAIKTDV
jgi:hypothetical protein